MPAPPEADPDALQARYRAPALEKGLDVLELLARTSDGLSLAAIVQRLGRSSGELFRMVQVLQRRGYIEQPAGDGEFRLADKLFMLGMQQPRTRNLVETALPVMRRLSLDLAQSCHLAVCASGEMVVVAHVESPDQIGFSVRIGYRRPLLEAVSGQVLLAFQPEEVRDHLRTQLRPVPGAAEWRALSAAMTAVRARGWVSQPSPVVESVHDLSAPILRDGRAAAALTVPYLLSRDARSVEQQAVERLIAASAELSREIGGG